MNPTISELEGKDELPPKSSFDNTEKETEYLLAQAVPRTWPVPSRVRVLASHHTVLVYPLQIISLHQCGEATFPPII